MSFKLFTSLAALVALAACESTDETRSGMHDWPTPSATVEGPVPGSAEHFKQNGQDRVFFGFDQSKVSPDAAKTLEAQAAFAKEYPSTNYLVEGHCDERGTAEYNMALGERRANSVVKTLVAHGVDKSRLQTVSYGKERATGQHDMDRNATTVVR